MTADDATTRLREALADSILDAIPDHTAWQDALLAADAILASLVEHRDDVLDVLGMRPCSYCGGDGYITVPIAQCGGYENHDCGEGCFVPEQVVCRCQGAPRPPVRDDEPF